MVISVDLGAFDEAIRAYNRILDIKQTHMDEQVLQIMAESAISGIKDSAGRSIQLGSLIFVVTVFPLYTIFFFIMTIFTR